MSKHFRAPATSGGGVRMWLCSGHCCNIIALQKTSCLRPTLLMFRVQNMAMWAFADMTKKAMGKLVRVAHRMGV